MTRRTSIACFVAALVLAACFPPQPPPPPTGGIPRGSTWSYWDWGGDLGSAWRNADFFEAGWLTGVGPLGFGESYIATETSPDPVTTYFRHELISQGEVSSIRLEALVDDGYVMYLNGTEIHRQHMPPGRVDAATLALGHEATVYETTMLREAAAFLVEGVNVLAVEVHQSSVGSSDLVWDASLVLERDGACASPIVEAWTGTATRDEAMFGTDDITADVLWQRVDTSGCVDTYRPTGTATYFYGIPGALCLQTVEPQTVPVDPSDGVLEIDRTSSPPRYRATAATSWPATWICSFPDDTMNTMPVDAGGVWLDASGTIEGRKIEGTFAAEAPDCHLNERPSCTYAWTFIAVEPSP